MTKKPNHWLSAGVFLAVATGVGACSGGTPGGSAANGAARIVFLDVGQGDATLVISPEGRVALIDAGPSEIDLVSQLRRHGVDTVDVAIATHPHADHIGGMAGVFGEFPFRYYMDNGVPHTTRTYRELMETVQRSDVTYIEATGRSLRLGSVKLGVLPPPSDAASLNNGSIGILVEFGAFRALLTGDSEIEELNHFIDLGVPDVDLLKAAHHGSRDGVSPGWLSATKPEVVVISCGRGNQYGHPHSWALRYYETVASEVYRTDADGEVIVVAGEDGEYSIITGRTPTLAQRAAQRHNIF